MAAGHRAGALRGLSRSLPLRLIRFDGEHLELAEASTYRQLDGLAQAIGLIRPLSTRQQTQRAKDAWAQPKPDLKALRWRTRKMRSDFGYLQGERFLPCHIELIDIYRSNLDARGQRATWHVMPIRSIGTPASRATLAYSARQPSWPRLAQRHAGTNSHTGHRGTIGTMAIVPGWHRGASVLIYRLCFFGFRSSLCQFGIAPA
jgi:hypothetical protein